MGWISGIFGARSTRADLDNDERAEMNRWLEAHGCEPSTAMYSVYRNRPYSEVESGAVIIGVVKTRDNDIDAGFCLEYAFNTIVQGQLGFAGFASRSNAYASRSKVSDVGIFAQFSTDASSL